MVTNCSLACQTLENAQVILKSAPPEKNVTLLVITCRHNVSPYNVMYVGAWASKLDV